jgi:hypothetical protein
MNKYVLRRFGVARAMKYDNGYARMITKAVVLKASDMDRHKICKYNGLKQEACPLSQFVLYPARRM